MIALALKPEANGYHGLSWGNVGKAEVYASVQIVGRMAFEQRYDCFVSLGQRGDQSDWADPRLPGRPVLEFKTSAASVAEVITNTRDWLENKLGQPVNLVVAMRDPEGN
ncbi:MAG: hypothetical protein Unbinned3992contig1000_17 [Prokaryotic dsDNA virus sp.]|nr:MAG: hypothetical protein Unbinned3992contig1000_17 [Prokaryotic dsDNA virus sp.]